MSHEEIAEPLGAYALDAVDGDERAMVERHLALCPRCRAELQEHREVAGLLGHAGGDAPEAVWPRIAEALEGAPPRMRLAAVDGSRAQRPSQSTTRYLMTAAAAVAAGLVAVVGLQAYQQDRLMGQVQAALHDPLRPVLQTALDEPASRPLELRSADGRLAVGGAVTQEGVGYMRLSELPPLESDRTYQLWGAAGGRLVSLGVLGRDPGVISFPADPYSSFAITAEPGPGAVAPTGPPVASGGVL